MSDEYKREADLSDRFDAMCARWDITDESNNFGLLFMSFKEGWKASAAHSAARIAELETSSAVWRRYAVELHDQLMRRDGVVHVGYAVPNEILTEVTK